MKTIGVGIIGASPGPASWAANTHVHALRALAGYELKAVSTSRRESAEAAAAAYGVPAYDNAHDLIAHPGVDLVVVAVKVSHHHELVSAAMAAGKMVYSEWPLGIDLAQATDLAEKAEAAGVRTAVGLQARYAPEIRHARDLVAGGHLGTILSTTLVGSGVAWGPVTDRGHAYLYDVANGATTLTAAAMHAVEALTHVLGAPATVSATMAVRQHDVRLIEDGSAVTVTAPDQVAITGTLTSGAVLSAFYRGGVSRGENLRWEITGSTGELLITSTTPGNGNIQAVGLNLAGALGEDTAIGDIAVPGDPVPGDDDAGIADVPAGPARNVARLYAALARDIRSGSTTVPDFGHAAAQHRLAEAIVTAARTGEAQNPA